MSSTGFSTPVRLRLGSAGTASAVKGARLCWLKQKHFAVLKKNVPAVSGVQRFVRRAMPVTGRVGEIARAVPVWRCSLAEQPRVNGSLLRGESARAG